MNFAILLIVLVVAPWLNGGADLVTRPVFYVAAGVALLVSLADVIRGRTRSPVSPTTWLLLAAVLWIAFSLVPWQQNWLGATSLTLRESLDRSGGPISLQPAATRTQLSLLLAAAAIFFAASRTMLSEARIRWLSIAMVTNGAAMTFFGIVQRYTWNDKLFWYFELPKNETAFGPLVYHNLAGNYLVICLAVGFYALSHCFRDKRRLLSRLDAYVVGLVLLYAVVLLGLVCSLSRGAMLSALFAAIVVFADAASRGKSGVKVGWMVPLALVFAGLLFWVGMNDEVSRTLQTFTNGKVLNDGRLTHWADATRAAKEFLAFGCGAGAYGHVVAMYQQSDTRGLLFNNAHNLYLETLVVAGLPGVCILIALVLATMRRCYAAVTLPRPAGSFAYIVLFVLVAQASHAFFDYCLVIPAITFCTAIIAGFGVGLTSDGHASAPQTEKSGVLDVSKVGMFVGCMLAAGVGWAIVDSVSAARVEQALRGVAWDKEQSEFDLKEVDGGIELLKKAIESRPDSVEAQEALATLQTVQYRLHAREQLTAETGFALTDPNLWKWTSPMVLHNRAHTLAQQGRTETLEAVRAEPMIRDRLLPALGTFRLARAACPLLPTVHLRIEELSVLEADTSGSDDNSLRLLQTCGTDFDSLYQCGVCDFSAGRFESAYLCWRKSLELSPVHVGEIIPLAVQNLHPSELFEKILPSKPQVVVALHESEVNRGDRRLVDVEMLAKKASELLSTASESSDPDFELMAQLASIANDEDESVRLMERALKQRPDNVKLRFRLAKKLLDLNRVEESERQAVICARLSKAPLYQNFLNQLQRVK